jgi:hypothetical protein
MAGSLKWFLYTDDTGTEYAIKLDESNTEAINADTGDYVQASTTTASVPRNIKVREVFYTNPSRTRTIRCVPLTAAIYTNVLNGDIPTISDPIDTNGDDLGLIRANGERRILPTPLDTGLTDGDDT